MKGFFIISLFLLFGICSTSRILFLMGYSTKSHMNGFWPVIDALHTRGHEILVISPIINKHDFPAIKQLELTANKQLINEVFEDLFEISNEKGFFYLTAEIIPKVATLFYNDSIVQGLLREKPQYDLIVTDSLFNDFILPVAHELGAPIMYICTAVLDTWTAYFMDVPTPFAYVPNGANQYSTTMNFFQRLNNVLSSIMAIFGGMKAIPMSQGPSSNALPNAPKIEELRRNVSLILVNSDPVLDVPRPVLPTVVRIGPIFCRRAKQLPKDFEAFVQNSGNHGFIILSLGTLLKGRRLPQKTRQAFVSAFARIPQKVIWKFEEKLEGLSDNVKIVNWMPQQDLLAHPKAKLFITHSGMLSIQESVYHGVPVLGIPVFGDQFQNIGRTKDLGFGEALDLYSTSEEEIYNYIQKMIHDKRYNERVKKYSAIMKDQPEEPSQRAVYWTEYIIRHKGAPHLRTPAKDLNFVEYFLLDVFCFILSVIVVAAVIVIYTIRILFRFCSFRRKEKVN